MKIVILLILGSFYILASITNCQSAELINYKADSIGSVSRHYVDNYRKYISEVSIENIIDCQNNNEKYASKQIINRIILDARFRKDNDIAIVSFSDIENKIKILIIDTENWAVLNEININTDGVESITINANSETLISGHYVITRIWDIRNGRLLKELFAGPDPDGFVTASAASVDGLKLITGEDVSTTKIWDLEKGKLLLEYPSHDYIKSVGLSPDGKWALAAGADNVVRVWLSSQSSPVTEFRFNENRVPLYNIEIAGVNSTSFSPDSASFAAASGDCTARIWGFENAEPKQILQGHSAALTSIVYSPDGSMILTASYDRTARLWDIQSGRLVVEFTGHSLAVFKAVFSPDGSKILTISTDRTIRLWSVKSGMELRRLKF